MEKNLTDDNFEKEIKSADKLILVDFFATWCNPCFMLAPILDKIVDEFKEKVVLMKVDIDANPLIAQKFSIEQIPTVILFKNGKPVGGFVGLRTEEDIKDLLENVIKTELFKESNDYAEKSGFKLNPDKEVLERVINGLAGNEKKYGKRYCPCRRRTGNQEDDSKKICPCYYHKGEIEKDGHCLCGLFYS
jgi:ferredoxin-thioredoxin reductase catalytic chain